MSHIYTLAYFECDLNSAFIEVKTEGPTPFHSRTDALKHLLTIIKPQLKVVFKKLIPHDGKSECTHYAQDFENVISYAVERGGDKLEELISLYFSNIEKEGFHAGYIISKTQPHPRGYA